MTPIKILFVVEVLGLLLPTAVNWDKARRGFDLALRSLWLHKLRAVLSVLGIIIGTAAVIALMAFGTGSMQDALDEIRKAGATNIIVRSVKPPDEGNSGRRTMIANYGLTYEDYDRFTTIQDVIQRVPMRVFPVEVRHLDRVSNARLVATTPLYLNVHDVPMSAGRFLTDDDDFKMSNVVALGAGIADDLFPFDDPLGKTVNLGKHFYTVVGVVKDRMPTGGSGGSQAAEDFNRDVYLPLQTCKVRFGERIFIRSSGSRSGEKVDLHQVTLTVVNDMSKVRPVGDLIRDMLTRSHQKRDWVVTVPLDRLEQAENEQARFTRLLVLIASISLLVGGIGIMNIMLATVTERTREIGIRRALGAKRRDITLQFLVEAVVQTSIGGLAGVAVGLASALLVPYLGKRFFDTHLPAIIDSDSIFLSLGVSIGVGVLFGFYPAWRAARLDPIEALRHD